MSTDRFDKLLGKARESVKRKNYVYAVDLYLQVLTMSPDHEPAAKELRAVQIRQCQEEGRNPAGDLRSGLKSGLAKMFGRVRKDPDKAIMSYESTLKKHPYHIKTLASLAAQCADAGYIKRAKVNYETIIEADRNNIAANKALGRICKDEGEFKDAEKYYARVLQIAPNDVEASRAVKDLAASGAVKQFGDAGDSYRNKLRDQGAAAKLEAGQHVIRTEADFDRALQAALEEIEEKPDDSKRHRKVGDLYLKVKEYDKALEYYEQAAEINPQDNFAQDKIADVNIARFDERIKEAGDDYRTKPGAETKAALEDMKQEKVEFSIQEWERRTQAHPTDARLKFQLGKLYMKVKRYDDAITQLQKTTNDPKMAVRAHSMLGLSFVKNKHHELGIQEFEKALSRLSSMDDQKKEVTYNMARTLETIGKYLEALESYRSILSEDYNYKDVKDRVNAVKEKTEA